MSIRRYVAANGREALSQVRRELGEDALVLSTRKLTGGRVEVLAVGSDSMQSLIEQSGDARAAAPVAIGAPPAHAAPSATASGARVRPRQSAAVAESFESFLQRQAKLQAQRDAAVAAPAQRHEGAAVAATEPAAECEAAGPARAAADAAPQPGAGSGRRTEDEPVAEVIPDTHLQVPATLGVATTSMRQAEEAPIGPGADARLLAELQSMRALLLEQMATMGIANSAADLHRRSPTQVRVMARLLTAGFSAEVARHIAERAPTSAAPDDCDRWLADVLALNVRCTDAAGDWLGSGGIFALVGPTGVGKTTTVAKLAARFVVRHGAQALGLITLDAFRVGAHEQLRAYGRILGTPVHLAQDTATLRELIASMAGKRLVLIDTCGVSQRDERLLEMLEMLREAGAGQRPIERLLLLNAASHAETLDDVARAWEARQCVGALLTKLDEAVRIGGALDCTLRHKLVIHGATNGQRVPEDWLAVDSKQLAAAALRPGRGPFMLGEAESAVIAASTQAAGRAAVLAP